MQKHYFERQRGVLLSSVSLSHSPLSWLKNRYLFVKYTSVNLQISSFVLQTNSFCILNYLNFLIFSNDSRTISISRIWFSYYLFFVLLKHFSMLSISVWDSRKQHISFTSHIKWSDFVDWKHSKINVFNKFVLMKSLTNWYLIQHFSQYHWLYFMDDFRQNSLLKWQLDF